MSASQVFIDTNILIHAHDRSAGQTHIAARKAIEDAWHWAQAPSVSVQVLQEMYVNLVRKQVSDKQAGELVRDYLSWRVIDNTGALLVSAIEIRERWQLSFWDASIVAAAQQAQALLLWSEDLNEGQDFDGVVVHNPLIL